MTRLPPVKFIPQILESKLLNVNNRVGRRSMQHHEVDALPSNKLLKTYHGAQNYVEYRDMRKSKSSFSSLRIRDSLNIAAHDMEADCYCYCNTVRNSRSYGVKPTNPSYTLD